MTKILQLIWAFMQIGITAFGGGLSTLPLIEYQLVTKNGWMNAAEFNQMVAVSQVTPGPIAINAATFAGYQQAGFWGSVASTVALFAAGIGLIKFSKFFKENPAAMLIIFGIFGGFFLR